MVRDPFTALSMVWTEEGMHEARVAKHAFEEFALALLCLTLPLLPQCCKTLTALCCTLGLHFLKPWFLTTLCLAICLRFVGAVCTRNKLREFSMMLCQVMIDGKCKAGQ